MELVHEMTMRCVTNGGVVTPGPGPLGMRVVASLSGGTVTGTRINGTMQGAGADWLLIGSDGYGRVDVRGQIVTDDGAAVYVQYLGLLELTKAVGTASVDPTAETGYGDQYFRIRRVSRPGRPLRLAQHVGVPRRGPDRDRWRRIRGLPGHVTPDDAVNPSTPVRYRSTPGRRVRSSGASRRASGRRTRSRRATRCC